MQHRLPFRAMGCEMLAILEQDSESMPPILNEIPAWFEEWEESLSRFRLNSELSRLNRTFDQPVEVSEAFWDVFQTALWADELTEGLVTPTVLDAVIGAGYDRPFANLPAYQTDSMMPTLIENHPLSMIVTDESARTINLPFGVRLDFGGIAKGWAAHQTVERLQEYGSCLMNCGGDIAISGPRADGRPWPIGVSNPFETGTNLEVLYVKRSGVASSGKDRRHWNRNGKFQHHIINPLTGMPAETNLLRVTVVAPTAMEAEAAAKTAFILGWERGLEWIETQPAFASLMILDDGGIIYSQKMQEYLQGVSNESKSK
ncbi:MAG: FAD:protein FMN transferase [Chloroflexi bacterium]|nr:FAD:protein FMN transferase [Chloroflexota bacterium]